MRASGPCVCRVAERSFGDPLDHERPFVVKQFDERVFATNKRSCYRYVMSAAGPADSPSRYASGTGPVRPGPQDQEDKS